MKKAKWLLACFCKELKQWRQIVVLLLIIVLFKQAALDFADDFLVPVVSKIQDRSWGVALIFFALPSLWYLSRFNHLMKKRMVGAKDIG